jgi:CubicO group peptidase (beta-lactamase class C family)
MQGQENFYEFSGDVLVTQKGKIIYKKAFGFANREWNIHNTIDSRFRIGSITKQFTAAAILQLADNGKLNLDDKLSKYFPDFPKGDSVTIHMLLNHSSGIKDYTTLPNFLSLQPLSLSKDSVVALFKNQPYNFRPGTQWSYCNSGYFLLGLIIEKVSGQDYGSYLLQNIIGKAGLHHTAVDKTDTILVNRAMGYAKTPSGWRTANFASMEIPYSAGSIFSTVDDMYQWNKALFGNKVISAAMFSKMTTPYLNHYGYGLYIDSLLGRKSIRHNGGIAGFFNHGVYFPDEDVYIIVLSNNGSESRNIANALSAILFGTAVISPYTHKEIKIDPRDLDKYPGKYITTDISGSINIELIKKGDKLFRKTGMNEVEIFPESNTKFFFGPRTDAQINFIVDANNTVVRTELIRNGFVSELKKIQ